MIVKTRKVGNSTVLTVPKDFNVKNAKEFTPKMLPDGSILFVPKRKRYVRKNILGQGNLKLETNN